MTTNNSFRSKSILRPSTLTQHTLNFNKILEQIPAPKLDESDLKLLADHNKPVIVASTTITKPEEKSENANVEVKDQETSKEFIFGENVSERVVNIVENSDENEASSNNVDEEKVLKSDENVQLQPQQVPESEHETTIGKLNCKLFLLDNDKKNWSERGYGLLKVLKTSNSFKLCMWTDKSFRLILNIKLFENMLLDKPNRKSIRLNGYDGGMLRIFLIKTANANDCDDLYDTLYNCVDDLKKRVRDDVDTENNTKESEIVILKFECDVVNMESQTTKCEFEVYKIETDLYLRLQSTDNNTDIDLNTRFDLCSIEKNDDSTVQIKTQENTNSYTVKFDSEFMMEKLFHIYNDVNNTSDQESSACSSQTSSPTTIKHKNEYSKRSLVNDENDEDNDEDDEDDNESSKKARISLN